MNDYSKLKKKKRRNPFLPIMGLAFAALIVVVSYTLAPIALETIGSFNDEWDAKIRIDNNPNNDVQTDLVYVMTFVVWLVLMGLSMMLVSVAIGKDPSKESIRDIPASPANKQAVAKQLKRDLRDAKRRARQQGKRKKQS